MKRFTIILCCCYAVILQAQQDLGFPHLGSLGQSTTVNPAHKIDSTEIVVHLLDISANWQYNGLQLDEIIQQETGRKVANVDIAIQNLAPIDNGFFVSEKVEFLRVQYNTPKWSLFVHNANRFQGEVNYPKSLAQVAWQGNAQFIGETVDIGPSFDFLSYNEYGIGGAVQVGAFRLGATFKMLSGLGAAKTTRNKATLHTSEDIYQLTLDTDYAINVADLSVDDGLVDFGVVALDFSSISLRNFEVPEFSTYLGSAFYTNINTRNRGIAVDLGATYQLDEQWQFGISILDIGKINWRENAKEYTSKETSQFNGLNIGLVDFENGDNLQFESLKDSIDQVINFTQTTTTFSTNLATQAYFTAQYKISPQLEAGLSLYGRFGNTNSYAASAGLTYQVFPFLQLGAVYTAREDAYFNMGFNATIAVGFFRLYAVTDNIATVFAPLRVQQQTSRVGMAFVFK